MRVGTELKVIGATSMWNMRNVGSGEKKKLYERVVV